MPRIRLYRGRTHLYDRRLEQAELVIGRSAEADIPLDAPAASRRHVRIFRQRLVWYAEHLGKKNPALLNKRPFTMQKLKHGDTIAIAEHALLFDYPPDEQARDREVAAGRAGAAFRMDSTRLDDAMKSDGHDQRKVEAMRRNASENSTMAVSPNQLEKLIDQMESRRGAMLVLAAEGRRTEYSLEGERSLSIGWTEKCGARLPGFRFFGKVGAALTRLSNGGHSITPATPWVKVFVEDKLVETDRLLRDKDMITLQHAFGFGKVKLRYQAAMVLGPKKGGGSSQSIGPR
jgi:pSer/pThr/pTyr-binding forkhead associated (FHA) protein